MKQIRERERQKEETINKLRAKRFIETKQMTERETERGNKKQIKRQKNKRERGKKK